MSNEKRQLKAKAVPIFMGKTEEAMGEIMGYVSFSSLKNSPCIWEAKDSQSTSPFKPQSRKIFDYSKL